MHKLHHRKTLCSSNSVTKYFASLISKSFIGSTTFVSTLSSRFIAALGSYRMCALSVAWMNFPIAHVSHFSSRLSTSSILMPSTWWSVVFSLSWLQRPNIACQAVFSTSRQRWPHHHTHKQLLFIVPQLFPLPTFSLCPMLFAKF